MGVFQTLDEVVNRTSGPLDVRFDGQNTVLQPNYDAKGNRLEGVRNLIPDITVEYAKIQNTLMGSESAQDPSDFQVLVGRVAKPGQKQKDDISFLEQSEAPTRVRLEEYLNDDNLKVISSGRKRDRRALRSEAVIPNGVDMTAMKR